MVQKKTDKAKTDAAVKSAKSALKSKPKKETLKKTEVKTNKAKVTSAVVKNVGAVKEKSVLVKVKKEKIDLTKKLPKEKIITGFGISKVDTGSPEVQVGLITNRIEQLVSHLKINKKDVDSRKGLLRMVGKRRRLLKYLASKDEVRYKAVLTRIGLSK